MELRTEAEKNTSMVPVDNIRKSQENNHVKNASIPSSSSSAKFASNHNIPHYTNMASDHAMQYSNQRISYPNLQYNPLSELRGLINLPTPNRSSVPYPPASIQRPVLTTNPYFANRFRYSPPNVAVLMNRSHSGNSNVCNVSNAFPTNQNVRDLPNDIHKRVENMDFQQTIGSKQTGTLTPAATMKRSRLEAFEIERFNKNINHDSSENSHSKDLAKVNQTINFRYNLFANIEKNYNKNLGKTDENCIKSLTIHAFRRMAIEQAQIHPLFQLPDEAAMVSESQPKTMEDICHEVHKQIYSAIEQKKLNGGLIYDFPYLSNANEILEDSTNSSITETNRKRNKFVASATYYPSAYIPYNSSTPTYQCCVCIYFSSSSVYKLLDHMDMFSDECLSGRYNHSWATFKDNLFTCIPCDFKTKHRQSFKKHKIGKRHAQFLSRFCCTQNGGTKSAWLPRNNEIRPIVQCHACNFGAHSTAEIYGHSKEIYHLINERLYHMLSNKDFNSAEQPVTYKCQLCNETVATKNELLHHFNQDKHALLKANHTDSPKSDFEFIEISQLQKEGFSSHKSNAETKKLGALYGNNIETETENCPTDKCDENQSNGPPQCPNRKDGTVLENSLMKRILIGRTLSLELPTIFYCPFCHFENVSELFVRMHVLKHSRLMSTLNCPLCILGFNDSESLRSHASNFHHVSEDNLIQITILAGQKQWISSENFDYQTDVPLEPMYPNVAKLRLLLKESQLPMLQIYSTKQNNENALEKTSLEKCNGDARPLSNQEQCDGTNNNYSIDKICGKLSEDVQQYEYLSNPCHEDKCISPPQSASEISCSNDTNPVQQN